MSQEIELGAVEDYYSKVGVITIILKADVKVGDAIHVKGHTTDFTDTVGSIQIEHDQVQSAKVGDPAGIKVTGRARKGDIVYKVLP